MTLPEALVDAIEARLAVYNDDRTYYTLSPAEIVQVAREAANSPERFAIRHGGKSNASTRSTIALAVRPLDRDDVIVVGIGNCMANAASPGIAWESLKPWRNGSARNADKVQAWLADPDVSRVEIPIAALGDAPIPQSRDALLAEILANPDDDTPRLVYADWLSERGDPRGELIVVQCALEHAADPAERERLAARAKKLVDRHGRTWKGDALQFSTSAVIRRGFVYAIVTTAPKLAMHGAALLGSEPIECVGIAATRVNDFDLLAELPLVAKFRELRFTTAIRFVEAEQLEALRRFIASPHVAAIPEIGLSVAIWNEMLEPLAAVLETIDWPNARRVNIDTYGLDAAQRAVLAAALGRAKLPSLVAPPTFNRE